MKKKLYIFLKIIIGLFIFLYGFLYFYQEHLIFFPQKLEHNYHFNFKESFKEININTQDDKTLNGLLFKSDSTKGLIFYLHGNADSLSSWGNVAKTYTNLNYDIFILDYRGYGKSDGNIKSQEQLFKDNQLFYNKLKEIYKEENIIILGYSIGSGMAAKLASDNNPKQLILQAPYYSLIDMMHQRFSFVPSFLLKYKFKTNEYLKKCQMPITIFHGNRDRVIYYGSSLKLKHDFKDKIKLITLDGQGHNAMSDNEIYKIKLKEILEQ